MEVLTVHRHRVSKRMLAEVERVLRGDGVVAFPTETSYGLAADPRNVAAVAKVFRIKRRAKGKPLPYVAASEEAVRARYALTVPERAAAKRYWPGPVTMVLVPKRAGKRRSSAGGTQQNTHAVRVPKSAWARAVAAAAGGIVTSTSANLSGDAAIYSAHAIVRQFSGAKPGARPDLVIDAGTLPKRRASAIIRIAKNGAVTVLRPGARRLPSVVA